MAFMVLKWTGAACLIGLGCLVGQARADLPQIRLDRIVPLGGEAGAEVALEIVKADLFALE